MADKKTLSELVRQYFAPVRETITDIPESYNDNVDVPFRQLAGLCKEQWGEFEAKECAPLAAAEQSMKLAVTEDSPTRAVEKFRLKLRELEMQFRSSLRQIYWDQFHVSEERLQEEKELQQAHKNVSREIKLQALRMAGDPNANIERVNMKKRVVAVACVGILISILEALTGVDMFRFVGNTMMAVGTSAIVVMVLTASCLMSANGWAIILAHKDAEKAFEAFMSRPKMKQYTGVQLLPLSRTTIVTTQAATAVFVLLSVGLFVTRLFISLSDPLMGWQAMMGTGALLFIAWAFGVYELRTSPRFEKLPQQRWEKLVDEEDEIEYLLDGVHSQDDAVQQRIEEAKKQYNDDVQQALEDAQNRQSALNRKKEMFLDDVAEYGEAWNVAEHEYKDMVNEGLRLLYTGRTPIRPLNDTDLERLAGFFAQAARKLSIDLQFASRLPEVNFTATFPTEGLQPDLDEVCNEVREEVRQDVASGRIVRPEVDVPQIPLA